MQPSTMIFYVDFVLKVHKWRDAGASLIASWKSPSTIKAISAILKQREPLQSLYQVWCYEWNDKVGIQIHVIGIKCVNVQ